MFFEQEMFNPNNEKYYISFPVAFVFDSLVLPKETYPCNIYTLYKCKGLQ